MNEAKNYIDEKVENWFKAIEDKLRNSFHDARADNDSIKLKIEELKKIIVSRNSKDFESEKFMAETRQKLEELAKKVSRKGIDLIGLDVERIDKDIKGIRNSFAKQAELDLIKSQLETKKQQKNDIKREVTNELHDIFEKKIDSRFAKFLDKSIELRKDVLKYRKNSEHQLNNIKNQFESEKIEIVADFQARIDKLIQASKEKEKKMTEEFNHNKENILTNFHNTQEELIKNTNKTSSSMKREVTLWKNYFKNKLEYDLKKRDERIEILERQISYLKGRINLVSKGKFIEEQKEEKEAKKKGLFSGMIDGLSDDSEKETKETKKAAKKDSKQTKKVKEPVKHQKIVKKLEKSDDKGFLTKIVDGLSG